MGILEDKLAADNPVEIHDTKAATEQGGEKPSSEDAKPDLNDGKDPSPDITEPSPDLNGKDAKPGDTGKEENAKPWYEEAGFKTEADAVKSYKELRAYDTRLAQEKAEIEKRMAGYEATIQQLQKFFAEPTREETEDPESAELNEKIVKTPAMKEVINFLGELQEERRRMQLSSELNTFKQNHPDYSDYEKTMADILGGMDEKAQAWLMYHPGGYPAALDYLYNEAKIKNFTVDLEKKKALAADEKKKSDELARGSINLTGEAIDPAIYGGGNAVNPDKDQPFDGTLRYFTE